MMDCVVTSRKETREAHEDGISIRKKYMKKYSKVSISIVFQETTNYFNVWSIEWKVG